MTEPRPKRRFLLFFLRDEDGAVTTDWVVLTAAIVALVIAVMQIFQTNITTASTTLGTRIVQTTE